jgi:beta-lactamase regulating signal transducer with metallopeptidase domain
MKLDAPNRLFFALALACSVLGAYAVCGVIEGTLVPVVATSVTREGWGALLSVRLMPTLIVLTVAGVALAGAGRMLARQAVASRRLARRIDELAVDVPARLVETSRAVGLNGRVIPIGLRVPVSFVHGVLRPRVVISEGLLERLSSAELLAVLEHERYHVSNLDPLKTATLRVMTALVPELDPFRAQYRAGCELAADRRAIATCGTRPLAGALLNAVGGPDWADTDLAVPLGTRTLLHERVVQLESGAAQPAASLAPARPLLTVLPAMALLALISTVAARASGVDYVTFGGLVQATLLRGLVCAVPLVLAGMFAYALLALRATSKPPRPSSG